MGLTINTNLEAMNASRNLNNTENMLATSMQRLSSGLKINSAADDVAGYAISESLQSQVNGLNQASENIQDAVALAQTAQGALNDVNQMLQRIRELAVQYSNGTTSTEDQTAIISEVSQLVEEIKRVGETTQFNGKSLLDGDEEISFQVGANDGEHVGVTTIELYKSIEAKLEITTLGERLEGSEEVSKEVKEAKETALTTAETALTTAETALTTPANELTSAEGAVTTAEGEISTAKATYESEIENDELNKSEDKAEAEVTQASEKTAIEGKEATLVTLKATATEKEEAVTPLKKTVTEAEAKVTKEEKEITTLKAAIKAADEPAKTATGLKELSEAIAKVAGLAGEFGAVQDRIQYTQSNLEVYSQNLTSAVSALDDVNMATEMTNFTKDQVLQQAGVSILAQANQLPDATLKLLE